MKLGGEEKKDGRAERIRLFALILIFGGAFIAFQQLAPSLDIEGWLENLAADLGDLTYALVGLLAFAETGAFIGLVFPGETAVIIGGALAGQGQNSVVLMLAIVWFCAWAGDSVSFLLGQKLGREFVLKNGPKVRITHERFAQVEKYFDKHGGKTILIGHFIGLVRALAPFVAGSSGMSYRRFVPFSVVGTGLWATTFCVLGYIFWRSFDQVAHIAGQAIFGFGLTVAVIFGIVTAYKRRAQICAWVREHERHPLLRPLLAITHPLNRRVI